MLVLTKHLNAIGIIGKQIEPTAAVLSYRQTEISFYLFLNFSIVWTGCPEYFTLVFSFHYKLIMSRVMVCVC